MQEAQESIGFQLSVRFHVLLIQSTNPSFLLKKLLVDPVKHERSYAVNAHYSNLGRPNYHLAADTLVRRVLLQHGSAKGVEFTMQNQTSPAQLKATKEILVAAGAVHTPKLLQLSGIGPKKVLDAAGIETLVDLPGVGQNFQDHANLGAEVTRKYKLSAILYSH